MLNVDPATVAWLTAGAYFTAPAQTVGAWAGSGTDTEIVTPLAEEADALAERDRQMTLLGGGPLVRDRHRVPGRRSHLIGRCLTLQIDRLGYQIGRRCVVLDVDEQADGTTLLTVIRRL